MARSFRQHPPSPPSSSSRLRSCAASLLLASLLLSAAPSPLPAQARPALAPAAAPPQPASPPRQLLTDVAANEIRAIQHENSYLRFRVHSVDAKGDRTRDTIESRDGSVARLILRNGKPLTGDEDKAETDRLNGLLQSPSDFNKHVHGDQTGKKLAVELIQLMPDAMTYTYVPGQPQLDPSRGSRLIVLDYVPNPGWSPPSTTAQALTGLRGRMWIDPSTRNLVRMEGTVFQGVNFGWGMLAHIYPGGQLALDQTSVGADRWIFTRFVENIRVRALMLKTINENATIDASRFELLPAPISYQDAIHRLLETPLPTR